MVKCGDFFLKVLRYLMLTVSILWLISSLLWLGAIHLFAALALLFLVLPFRDKCCSSLKRLYRSAIAHKRWLIVGAIIFQILLLLSAALMIRSDAAVVFTGATELLEADRIASYLTRNPNNLLLFLYERSFYKVFGAQTVWVLQVLNIFYVHLTAYVLYKTGQRYFKQSVADKVFFFYLLLIGLTPKFMAMYSDILILPFLALQLYLVLDLSSGLSGASAKWWKCLLLGGITGPAIALRPTAAIMIIAFFAYLFLKQSWKLLVLLFSLFILGFATSYGTVSFFKNNQTEVTLLKGEGLEKNIFTFINLGLTFSGTDQEDMQEGLASYLPEDKRDVYNNGRFANDNQISEIKRRIKAYTPWTFLAHVLYKQHLTTGQGNLNWIYKDASLEKTVYISPLAETTKNNPLAQFFRNYFIYSDQPTYKFYDFAIQLVWICLSIGLFLFFSRAQPLNQEVILVLALFGGLLFLQVFEGGKSRYLIQFLPQILVIAALGLDRLKEMPNLKFFPLKPNKTA